MASLSSTGKHLAVCELNKLTLNPHNYANTAATTSNQMIGATLHLLLLLIMSSSHLHPARTGWRRPGQFQCQSPPLEVQLAVKCLSGLCLVPSSPHFTLSFFPLYFPTNYSFSVQIKGGTEQSSLGFRLIKVLIAR